MWQKKRANTAFPGRYRSSDPGDRKIPHVRIKGLMTIAPFVENPEENREVFKKLYEFAVDIGKKNIDNVTMDVLSMGMTGDYQVAIEEGATMVRVGTGIFGARLYGAAQ